MNVKIEKITDRQDSIVAKNGQRLILPLECHVTSYAQSASEKVTVLVIYQYGNETRTSSHYFGVIVVKDTETPFSLHLQRIELLSIPQKPFVWKVSSIDDSMVASFEIGRFQEGSDSGAVFYFEEKWRLIEAVTGYKYQ